MRTNSTPKRDRRSDPPLPDFPTDAEPGSAERVAVLEMRAALGQHLWHPADRRELSDCDGLATAHDPVCGALKRLGRLLLTSAAAAFLEPATEAGEDE